MKFRLLVLSLCLAVLAGTGCTKQVTFDQLSAGPGRFNGRNITIEGFYFHGFEVVVLCEGLKYSGHAEGHLVPEGMVIWIEGGIPQEVYDNLYEQNMMGPSERYGKIKITGKFESGGRYGHVGQYECQITPVEVELLPWSPPEK